MASDRSVPDRDLVAEALAWYDDVFGDLDGLNNEAPRRMKHVAAAARAWLEQGNAITDEMVERATFAIIEIQGHDLPMWEKAQDHIKQDWLAVGRAALVAALSVEDSP